MSYKTQWYLHFFTRFAVGFIVIIAVIKWLEWLEPELIPVHGVIGWLIIFPLVMVPGMVAGTGVCIWAYCSGPDLIQTREEERQHSEDGEPALYRRWDPVDERWAWFSATGKRYGYDPDPRPAPRRDPFWPPVGER